MTRKETIRAFCVLQTAVQQQLRNYDHPSDCFCEEAVLGGSYNCDGFFLEWLEKAAYEKLKRDTGSDPFFFSNFLSSVGFPRKNEEEKEK